jgi:hypothetical protein
MDCAQFINRPGRLLLMLGMLFRHMPWRCGHAWVELSNMGGNALVVKINLKLINGALTRR